MRTATASNVPFIVVLMAGGPVDISWAKVGLNSGSYKVDLTYNFMQRFTGSILYKLILAVLIRNMLYSIKA